MSSFLEQADRARALLAGCGGLTTWGITDAFSWIFEFFSVDGAPLLFGKEYERKPAYFGARDALRESLDEGNPDGLERT